LNIPVICMQSPRGLNDPALGKIRDVIAEADSLILIDKDVDFTLASGDLEHVPANNIVLIASNAESIAHASTMLAGRLKWGCIADPLVAAQILTDVTTIKGKSPWLRQVMKKIAVRPKPPQSTDSMIAHQVMTTINTVMADANPIYVIDGGEVGQWAQSVLPLDQALINGTSGAIGGSLPQAIGAALAQPKRPIIAIMGDGTAGFYLSELDTARRLGLKLIVVIVNDLRWGAEAVIQERVYGKDRVQGCLLDDKTRYDQIAQGFGANGLYAETPEALQKALIAAGKNRKPTVINAMIKGMPAPSF
jgi:acetolactate synthase-1/2/3 large subunit